MTQQHKPSDEERERRRAQDRERLKAAAEQLLSSDGWQRWVRTRAANGLSRYSINNQLLIAMQTGGTATFVAGFHAWLKLGYAVDRGQKAIRIFAPMPVKRRDERTEDVGQQREESEGRPRVLFRSVAVFDRRQVSPVDGADPAPLQAPCEPLSGHSHGHLLARLETFASSIGFSVDVKGVAGAASGWCDPGAKRIVVDARLPANAQLRVLVHELAHALGVGYREYGRERAEVIVDTVTFVVCGSVGLDISGESIPYVAGWGEHGALDAAMTSAAVIDELARRLEDALAENAQPAPALARVTAGRDQADSMAAATSSVSASARRSAPVIR
jgi:N-terminal domain of anti-restriction factor ArdC